MSLEDSKYFIPYIEFRDAQYHNLIQVDLNELERYADVKFVSFAEGDIQKESTSVKICDHNDLHGFKDPN